MYKKLLEVMIGIIIQEYLLSNGTPPMNSYTFLTQFFVILVMMQLAAELPQYIYQGMCKYVVVGLFKTYWNKHGEKLLVNGCVLF